MMGPVTAIPVVAAVAAATVMGPVLPAEAILVARTTTTVQVEIAIPAALADPTAAMVGPTEVAIAGGVDYERSPK